MVTMRVRKRIYDTILSEHLAENRQMAFVSGPRQVGKTTTCRAHADSYINWDNVDDQELVLGGPKQLMAELGTERLTEAIPVVLFDELHRYARWKQFLKGLFDTWSEELRIIVTGLSRLDTYRRVGDSLMGRYFLYRMHPFSVAETLTQELPDPVRILREPKKPKPAEFKALWEYGGYPEPFLRRDRRFIRRWQSSRTKQLLREDVRDQTQIQQVDQLAMLVRLLSTRSSHQIIYSSLAKQVRVSVDTMRRWIQTLSALHHGFLIRPWFKNVSRALRKEPKWFLKDWSSIQDIGDRSETFVACHLLKAVEGWTDLGLGEFELTYLRDKNQREVDFAVIRDGKPWFLVEVKHEETHLSPALAWYQEQTQAPYAFQVVIEASYVEADAFSRPRGPMVVPARTLLSQLM